MTTDKFLYIVNELLGYEDESKKELRKEDAEVYNVPVSPEKKETLYLFLIGDLEIGLFTGIEKDCIVSAYVRLLFDDTMVSDHMISLAGVFLKALEPNEYEKMLSSVLPAGEDDYDKTKAAFGEYWRVLYSRTLMTIVSKEENID